MEQNMHYQRGGYMCPEKIQSDKIGFNIQNIGKTVPKCGVSVRDIP